MKKQLALVMVFALLLPVLAGCQSAYATRYDPRDEVSTTREQAVDTVLTDAGLARQEVHDVEVEIDRDNGVIRYEVDLERDGQDYEYEIDAQTGEILDKKVSDPEPTPPPADPESTPAEPMPAEPTPAPTPVEPTPAPTPAEPTPAPAEPTITEPATPKTLTRQEVIQIVLTHAQLAQAQLRDLDVELDRDKDAVRYEVDFEAAGYEYEYEIHAETGEILQTKKERD